MTAGHVRYMQIKIMAGVLLFSIVLAPLATQAQLQWDTTPPVLLALDGIDPKTTTTTALGIVWSALRENNYLEPALRQTWGYGDATRRIFSLLWGGQLRDNAALAQYKADTRTLILNILNAYPDRPFIIIAHSWGSVVAYEVLQALGREMNGANRVVPSRAITAFITLGSPLGLGDPLVSPTWGCTDVTALLLKALWGTIPGQEFVLDPGTVSKPDVVAYWQNFWIANDCISSVKKAADGNVQFTWNTKETAHSAYITQPVFMSTIQLRAKKLLKASCRDVYTSSLGPTPEGYGVAYNTQSPDHELLVEASCDDGYEGDRLDGNTITLQVGANSSDVLVYKKAFVYEGNQWQELSLVGPTSVGDSWLVGTAEVNLKWAPSEYMNPRYVIGYTCVKSGQQFKCGCRDVSCAQSLWQLQSFEMQYK